MIQYNRTKKLLKSHMSKGVDNYDKERKIKLHYGNLWKRRNS